MNAHPELRAVDLELGALLRRLDPRTAPDVMLAAALASGAVARGHAAFDPARPQLALDDPSGLPDAATLDAALRASRWVDVIDDGRAAAADRPLVYERGLLYLRRYREYERRLAAGLRRLAVHRATSAPDPLLFARLFPDGHDPDQAEAVRRAFGQGLMLVTGGPGTGKTTTIARLLALQLHARHDLRIVLAAPTGRAAERMAESLRAARERLRADGVEPALVDALPVEARTVHRLLGTIPDSPRFRHDAHHPLPYDLVVVDEASMVDLPLMCKLVEAIADGAQLVLLGDRDQLPSVEAGDVLAAIVDAAEASGELPRVHLRRGWRQADSLQLAPLAEAVRIGDADTALALLREGLRGVRFHENLLDPLAGDGGEALLAPWRALMRLQDPAEALAQAGRQRVLTALRDGPQGAVTLNARIEEALAGAQRERYFHGRLLLVTENSYRHGLFNGDLGVCLRDGDGITAWFEGPAGPRGFHPGALPAHMSAFAMTVHKAQGSEFERVWLQLPRQDARPLSRELVYTALTRARGELHVAAAEPVLRAALARHAERVSGLAARLRG
ncbi:MAG TPA: exodeoxyribonuclease V subunit alpha [Lysobacter sp.]|nr:exodeoxyribonuclease V subunit alpha [Lysobacter sp.]